MIKQYFKQAWTMLKQNKLYSTIYILGTALGITMVMVIAIYMYTITGKVYPEMDRNRIYTVKVAEVTHKDSTLSGNASAGMNLRTVKECFLPLKVPEVVSASYVDYWGRSRVSKVGSPKLKTVSAKYVDPNFWKMYDFRFIEGHPFTTEEFQSGILTAVISKSLAQYLFPEGQSVGKRFTFNNREMKVSGVVADVSYLASNSFGNIWVPYTVFEGYDKSVGFGFGDVLGAMQVTIKLKHKSDEQQMRREVAERMQRYEKGLDVNIDLKGQPDNAFIGSFRVGNAPLDGRKMLLRFVLIVVVFLLVPALNLSGLNSSRMEKRMQEIGVRKAFGAQSSVLLTQVLVENFLLTLIGALCGLLLSFLLVFLFRDVLGGVMGVSSPNFSTGLTPSMMINFPVFFCSLLAALVINILSAYIPAHRFTHKDIMYSLHRSVKK